MLHKTTLPIPTVAVALLANTLSQMLNSSFRGGGSVLELLKMTRTNPWKVLQDGLSGRQIEPELWTGRQAGRQNTLRPRRIENTLPRLAFYCSSARHLEPVSFLDMMESHIGKIG